jgi:hypothetical protein
VTHFPKLTFITLFELKSQVYHLAKVPSLEDVKGQFRTFNGKYFSLSANLLHYHHFLSQILPKNILNLLNFENKHFNAHWINNS